MPDSASFALNSHSTKARKQDVLESLRKRLELQRLPEPSTLTETVEEHERLRKQLTWYVEFINQPFGQTGKKPAAALLGWHCVPMLGQRNSAYRIASTTSRSMIHSAHRH